MGYIFLIYLCQENISKPLYSEALRPQNLVQLSAFSVLLLSKGNTK